MFFGNLQWQACEKVLSHSCDEVYFSVSPNLKRALPVKSSLLVHDIFKESFGPLGGILSAFYQQPERAFMVLACDMPNFDDSAARFLRDHRNSRRLATVLVNENGDIEPLCAIYEPAIFPLLLHSWGQKVYCPRRILSGLDTERVLPENFLWLVNVNNREDFLAGETRKKIVLHFYASLREEARCSSVEVNTEASNMTELFLEMNARFNFSIDQKNMRFAKNHQLVERGALVNDGDQIVFIPPVSGG